ncbi:MAG: hypothetical protein HY966_01495 [Ignavibacteriales bacterium]|nr:hypothetical protein [Ignavibacteriales bacterium]
MEAKTKTILIVVFSFVLGAAAGGYSVNRWLHHSEVPPQVRQSWSKMFTERMHLDSVQAAKVDSIVTYFRTHIDWYRRSMMQTRDTTRTEIRKILSAEQNKLFDDYIKEMNERESKRHEPANQGK